MIMKDLYKHLSNIKTGKISAICDVLDCQPGDILEYEREKN